MRSLLPSERNQLTRLSLQDVDCLPLVEIVRVLSQWCFDRGDVELNTAEMRDLFAIANLTNPRTGKQILPSPAQITAAVRTLSNSQRIALIPTESGYSLPWRLLKQEWILCVRAANRGKAIRHLERLSERTGRDSQFVHVREFAAPDLWSTTFSAPLQALAWPCAVAEAVTRATSLHKAWSLVTGLFGIEGAQILTPPPPIHEADWKIIPIMNA